MHTPGPWEAKRTPESTYFDWSVVAKSGPGRVMSIGIDTDNTEDDARLIAAAPHMLSALQAILSMEPTPAIKAMALTAIAKTQGDSNV